MALTQTFECPYCRLPSPAGKTCTKCATTGALNGLVVAAPYDATWKTIIHQYKFSFIESSVTDIYQIVSQSWEHVASALPKDTIVIPVPLSRRRALWRGFNQSALLARRLAEHAGLTYGDVLIRTGRHIEQSRLTRAQRLINAEQQSFTLKPVEKVPQSVIIVDDVYTTGATIEACARALQNAGVTTIWGCVIARGVLKNKKIS